MCEARRTRARGWSSTARRQIPADQAIPELGAALATRHAVGRRAGPGDERPGPRRLRRRRRRGAAGHRAGRPRPARHRPRRARRDGRPRPGVPGLRRLGPGPARRRARQRRLDRRRLRRRRRLHRGPREAVGAGPRAQGRRVRAPGDDAARPVAELTPPRGRRGGRGRSRAAGSRSCPRRSR
jgi:hypothetical protein